MNSNLLFKRTIEIYFQNFLSFFLYRQSLSSLQNANISDLQKELNELSMKVHSRKSSLSSSGSFNGSFSTLPSMSPNTRHVMEDRRGSFGNYSSFITTFNSNNSDLETMDRENLVQEIKLLRKQKGKKIVQVEFSS